MNRDLQKSAKSLKVPQIASIAPIAPAASLRQVSLPLRSKLLTTPEVYKAATVWILSSTVLLTGAIANAVMSQRSAVNAVGFETTPSIYHAQRIRDSVADMDANVANLLLVPIGQNPDAEKVYQDRKKKLSLLLTRAAENITIPSEQTLISDISLNLNNYIEKVQEAKIFHDQGKREATLKAYREAERIVDGVLMVKADELDQVNFKALQESYDNGNRWAVINQLLVVLLGAVVVGSLVGLQILLTKWTNRRLNLGLLAATVIATVFILDTLFRLVSSSNLLKVAKVEAFDSLHILRKARSTAYSLNADESRYLLDSQFSTLHQENFFSKVTQLTFIPNGPSPKTQPDRYSSELRKIVNMPDAPSQSVIKGAFATQLQNITFDGERKATQTMINDFLNYFDIDQKIRTTSKREEAIALCTGKSNQFFDVFLESNQKVMDININAFDTSIYKALTYLDVNGVSKSILPVDMVSDTAPNGQNKGLDFFWIKALFITGAIAGFTVYGIRSRIAEYEA